jgi:uncharacterized protein
MDMKAPITWKEFTCKQGKYPVAEEGWVTLTAVSHKPNILSLEGSIEVVLEIPCDRCLQPVMQAFTIEVSKEMKVSEEVLNDASQCPPYLEGRALDSDKLAYYEILVNLPMKILCKEDCKGICYRCGTNLNHEACQCDRQELDPRMAQILDIFNQYKEV